MVAVRDAEGVPSSMTVSVVRRESRGAAAVRAEESTKDCKRGEWSGDGIVVDSVDKKGGSDNELGN